MTWMRISVEYLHFTGAFSKLPSLNVKRFILCFSIYNLVLFMLGSMEENFIDNICSKSSWA